MNKWVDVDPSEVLPRKGDLVKFNHGGFEWTVSASIPWQNTVHVRSVIGGRHAVGSITNILTMQRDLSVKPEPDYSEQYSQEITEDE